MTSLLLRDVEVRRRRVDVLVTDRVISAIGEHLAARADTEIDGAGGAVLPGLHDHHIHLLALAAARSSLDVTGLATHGFAEALRRAAGSGWLRVVGYDDTRVGPIGRVALDAIVGARPTRVQHRSGALWVCSSAAVALLGDLDGLPGVERDDDGEPTGRFWRADAWLAERWPRVELDLSALGSELASYGITHVADATPYDVAPDELGALPQHVTVLSHSAKALPLGPLKVVIADHELPDIATLSGQVADAHANGRAVALHCVTAEALLLALHAGLRRGDRLEHAAVVPEGLLADVAATGVTVVTQPGFVHSRGDDYLASDDPPGDLWRCASLRRAGVRVLASSDAPHGPLDPWLAVRTAVTRRTSGGAILGPAERLTVRQALALYVGPAVRPGARADLLLCAVPLAAVLAEPCADVVHTTVIAGRVV